MKAFKTAIFSTCLFLGIALAGLTPFVYNLMNPELSQMAVFTKIWWIQLIGMICMVISLRLSNNMSEETKGLPKYLNPPPPPEKKATLKDVYEYLETRALNKESVDDTVESEALPLWVPINDVHHALSMYHNEVFGEFIKTVGLCYDHGFGCDADDFKLPEFPDKEICVHDWKIGNTRSRVPHMRCSNCGKRKDL